jgi:hypothetical protein
MPDFWEGQFGLDPHDASDAMRITAGGYANIEHYFNNTTPKADSKPVVFIAATVSRADGKQSGEWRVTRTGDLSTPLTVHYTVSGDATAGVDFTALPDSVTIPAGKNSAILNLTPSPAAGGEKTVVITLKKDEPGHHVGCPSASLVIIRQAH